jgi:hypothetical protein
VVDGSRNSNAHGRSALADAVIAFLIAVPLVAAVSVGAVVVPIVWRAVSEVIAVNHTVNPRECATIASDKERLACFDRYALGLMTPPAKGAFAPAQAFGQSHMNSSGE